VEAAAVGTTAAATATTERWRTAAACCAFAVATCYADRSNVSTAIVAMKDAFEWDRASQGMILSAFFYGYAVTQIVGGETADARGGRAVLAFGVGAWSAATALTPMAAHAGVGPLVVTRVALGMSEGLAFPAAHAVIASEVPRERRSTAAAAVTAASYAGAAFAFAVTPGLIREFGWEGAFYAFGALGVLWIPFWLALSEDVGRGETTPPPPPPPPRRDDENEDDENESETARLTDPVASTSDWHRSFAVWQALMRRREVRAICVAQFTQSWGMYGLLSWLPTYFTEAHGVDLGDLPAFTFVPYLLQGVVGLCVGVYADDLINVRGVPVRAVRRAAQCVGHVGPACALLVAAASEGNPTLAAVSVDVGLALSALTLAGVSVSHLDVAPRHAGVVFGTGNTFATLAGVVAVPVSGAVRDATGSWSAVFVLIAIVYVSGATYWYLNCGGDDVIDVDAELVDVSR
jgi:ACS family sodium-dependent inorganic phosphate cotransporter